MSKTRLFLLAILVSLVVYSCKKENSTPKEETPILTTEKNSSDRINLTGNGTIVNFSSVATNSTKTVNAQTVYPFELEFNGKIESVKDDTNTPLTAIDVTSYPNGYFGVSYMTVGPKYYGGVDLFKILPSKAPEIILSVIARTADINKIKIGGNKVFMGLDLKNYESYSNLESPAVVGLVDINNGTLDNPQYIGLKGYSVQDLCYFPTTNKLYAASATEGGLSIISFNNGVASRTAFAYYGGLRSITNSNNDVIASNAYAYSKFNPTTGEILDLKNWPVQSDAYEVGAMTSLANGNFLFGNNYALIYVDKATGNLIDQVDVGGWIYNISTVGDKIYVAAGNNILVAALQNGHLNILAKTHFESTFGTGKFVINNVHVVNDKVLVTCGKEGTYIFTLKQK